MLNPGDYSLADLTISTALTAVAQTPITDLEGIKACDIAVDFAGGTGGTSCKGWIQTSFDGGTRWIDIKNFAFANTAARKGINLSALTPVTTAVTLTDGTMADDAVQDGFLGAALRAKITSVGTYSNTTLSVKINVK